MTDTFEFGPFRYYPVRRRLERDGDAVKVASRSLDLLHALLERPGSVLTNTTLTDLVWPNTKIDENSLRVHMSWLRKALGESRSDATYILNVPGQGYTFIAPVIKAQSVPPMPAATQTRSTLPMVTPRIIGRDRFISSIVTLLQTQRLVTIVGPGGVGKTTVAIAIARRMRDEGKEIVFVDLASVADPRLVTTALASSLELGVYSDDPTKGVLSYLAYRSVLLVLDNCEHVLDEVARLVEALLAADVAVTIIATSREPLDASGEITRRLQPLRSPPSEGGSSSVSDLWSYTAVEMFVDRTAAAASEVEMDERSLETVAEICRQLDGIPLALELAAARIEEFGLAGVSSRLADRYSILTKGRRTAADRQKTLRNTMDWSYQLLSDVEQATLNRVSIYSQYFELDCARAVSGHVATATLAADDVVASLVSKSLVVPSSTGDRPNYRMLGMTRDYARRKLEESGELDIVSHHHAKRVLNMLILGEAAWSDGATKRWTAFFTPKLPDLRKALNWAFSRNGDIALGVEIAAYSTVMLTPFGLLDEHRQELDRAIAANATLKNPNRLMDARLYACLGALYWYTRGHLDEDFVGDAFRKSIEAAKDTGSLEYQLRSISGLSASYLIRGRHDEALAVGKQFEAIAGGAESKAAFRTLAHSNNFHGNIDEAEFYLKMALGIPAGSRDVEGLGVEFDQQQSSLRTTQALHQWMRGLPEQAMDTVVKGVRNATQNNHIISLTGILASAACPISFMIGGQAAATPYVEALLGVSEKNSMSTWLHFGRTYQVTMSGKAYPDEETYLRENGIGSPLTGVQLQFLAALGDGYSQPWMITKALKSFSGWCGPELIRARGEMFLHLENDKVSAEAHFRQALAESSAKKMLAWELRAATSLARFLSGERQRSEAHDILGRTVARFEEGLNAVDYLAASELLEALSR